ncbi:migration and invasion-inhibitory protein isoform X7 [Grus americana]|uniref:migration and invasion-inhibitory protein isoform X7 n=1 Tax=Grus americana TaxID=9117 RepID=UPI002407F5F2|nr:migration and invasion-inhibitory protein isoform X7 [Grus americana]
MPGGAGRAHPRRAAAWLQERPGRGRPGESRQRLERGRGSPGRGIAWRRGGVLRRMELDHLKRLRQANQDLLQRLRMKQEEIRKRLPSKPLLPASLQNRTATERSVPLPERGKENEVNAAKSTADPAMLVSVEPRAYAARAALCSSLKQSSNDRGIQQQQEKMQEAVGLDSSFPGKEKDVMPVCEIIMCGRETSGVDRDGHARGSPEKESFLLGHGENRKPSALLCDFHEKKQLKGHLDPSRSKIQSEETSKQHVIIREPIIRKSILLTSQSKELKEAGHVTFQSDPEEYTMPVSSWSMRPFLGYDWIAGLLDTNSSIAEKSDQYFAELHEFRQANKEACVHEQHREPKALDYILPEEEPGVYCYRLNQRLFAVPVDSESACPVCKIPRSHQPPEILEEPAYVSIAWLAGKISSLPATPHSAVWICKLHWKRSLFTILAW